MAWCGFPNQLRSGCREYMVQKLFTVARTWGVRPLGGYYAFGQVDSVITATLRSGNKLVTRAVHGSQMDRVRRVPFQLLAQLRDMNVHGARCRIGWIAPDRIEELFSRDDALRVLQQERQKLELSSRELNLTAVAD